MEKNNKPLKPMTEAQRAYKSLVIARGMAKYPEYEKMVLEKMAKSDKEKE